jgi:hypothetical protein
MSRRLKKLPGSGDEEYFNEKPPVNVRVDRTAHLAEPSLFPRGMLTKTIHHRGPVRAVGNPEVKIPLGQPLIHSPPAVQ